MKNDELAIRELVETWLDASKRGDSTTVLSLMADDVLFLVPGQEPFGKEGWSESFPVEREPKPLPIDAILGPTRECYALSAC